LYISQIFDTFFTLNLKNDKDSPHNLSTLLLFFL